MKPCQHNISSVVENGEKVQPFFPYTANLLENKTLLPAAYFCFLPRKPEAHMLKNGPCSKEKFILMPYSCKNVTTNPVKLKKAPQKFQFWIK